MDFGLSEEQKLIVETTRAFVENELYPHETEVERTGVLRRDLIEELKAKAIEAGLYAANMPAETANALLAGLIDLPALAAASADTPTKYSGQIVQNPPSETEHLHTDIVLQTARSLAREVGLAAVTCEAESLLEEVAEPEPLRPAYVPPPSHARVPASPSPPAAAPAARSATVAYRGSAPGGTWYTSPSRGARPRWRANRRAS